MNKVGLASLAVFLGSLPCGDGQAQMGVMAPQARHESGLTEALSASGKFTTFLGLLEGAGIQESGLRKLAGGRPFTLLAPNDAAFAALPAGKVDLLRKDPKRLRAFLLAHILPGAIKVQDMFDASQSASHKDFKTAQGRVLGFSCDGKHAGIHRPVIDGRARVGTFQDVAFSGGVVHEIGGVLEAG